jgi:hypothetical protein
LAKNSPSPFTGAPPAAVIRTPGRLLDGLSGWGASKTKFGLSRVKRFRKIAIRFFAYQCRRNSSQGWPKSTMPIKGSPPFKFHSRPRTLMEGVKKTCKRTLRRPQKALPNTFRGFLGSERLPKTSGGAFYECRTGFDPNLEGGSKHRFGSNPQQVRNTKFDPNVAILDNDHRRHSIRT